MSKLLIFAVAFALALFSNNAVARANAACAFETVDDWKTQNVHWVGPCSSGCAHGLGVLRHTTNGTVDKIFYGRLEKGWPVLGAITITNSEFVAGKFAAGKFVEANHDRAVLIEALVAAEKAARATALRFEKEGNRESAKFYRARAEEWASEGE